jgi:ABC-2 type transport system permease protein
MPASALALSSNRNGALRRVYALVLRYVYLHRRSLPRCMEIFFWPLMNLAVWGFFARFVEQASRPGLVSFLLGSVVLWEVLYRAQQSISFSITEEIWARNIINLFIAPLRVTEIVFAACFTGVLKATATTLFMLLLSRAMYGFDVLPVGWAFVAFYGALLMFGWAVGLFTMALVFRFGRAAEALIWGVPFLIQPLSAVFYPVQVLPEWLQYVSYCLPSTYVFEGMRAAFATGGLDGALLLRAYLLNIPWLAAGGVYFGWMLVRIREMGLLSRPAVE